MIQLRGHLVMQEIMRKNGLHLNNVLDLDIINLNREVDYSCIFAWQMWKIDYV